MKRWSSDIVAVLIVGVVVGFIGLQVGRRQGHGQPPAAPPATAPSVRVTEVVLKAMNTDIIAYGQVQPILSALHVYSMPVEARVLSVAVMPGQSVRQGATLLRIEPSPDAALALEQARLDVAFAQRSVEFMTERASMQLATKAEVDQASNTLALAQEKLKNMNDRGLVAATDVVVAEDGVVNNVAASPGAIVPAGVAFVDVVPQGGVQVVLQVETEDVGMVEPGDSVVVQAVERGVHGAHAGTVRRIASGVDPVTRLVDVLVVTDDSTLRLNQYVEGRITVESSQGLVVPREAIVARPGSFAVFTIDGQNVAREHMVKRLAESSTEVMIGTDSIEAGDQVVIDGVSGLRDGSSVEIRP